MVLSCIVLLSGKVSYDPFMVLYCVSPLFLVMSFIGLDLVLYHIVLYCIFMFGDVHLWRYCIVLYRIANYCYSIMAVSCNELYCTLALY